MSRLDLFDGVVAFVLVAEEKNYRRAAERLGLTPAAVSKSVQRLELRLGIQLLHRTTRKVGLTREGEVYLERCREAVEQLRTGEALLGQSQEVGRGDLTVTMPMILGRFVIRRLPRFVERYPELKLHMRFTDRYSRLIDEGIDIAIRIGELEDSTMVARRLLEVRWVTVASPGYLARRGVPQAPEELREHRCLKFHSPKGVPIEWSFMAQKAKEPYMLRTGTCFDADQGELLVEAAIAGMGVTQAFRFLVEESLREGHLVEILERYAPSGPPIHALCLPGQQNNPRTRAMLDFLQEIFMEFGRGFDVELGG